MPSISSILKPNHYHALRSAVAVLTACEVLLSPLAPLVRAQTASSPPAQPASSASPAVPATGPDGGWPRDLAAPDGGEIRIFQPQIASWDGQRRMVAYAAVAYSAKGATKPALGTIKMEADTSVAVGDRLVNFTDFKMTETNFPNVPNDQLKGVVSQISGQISKAVPQGDMVIGLDRVLARLDKSQIIPKNIEGVKADPPTIFYSTSPAVLMNVDGDPIWSPIMNNDLKFAVNTNWDLFQDTPANALYLRYNNSWLTATDVKGPWKSVSKLPDELQQAAGRRQLERRQGCDSPSFAQFFGSAQGVRQHDAGRDDPAGGRSKLRARWWHSAALGEQHRERCLPAR